MLFFHSWSAIALLFLSIAQGAVAEAEIDWTKLLNQREDVILDPEQAFNLSVRQSSENNTLILHWGIAPGYYLYRDKITLSAKPDVLGDVVKPTGELKQDLAFGEVQVYYDQLELEVSLVGSEPSQGFGLTVGYQGCKEDTLCYPPIEKRFDFNIPISGNAFADFYASLSSQANIKEGLLNASFISNILVFFGFGILLSLTPCIFPMIPILSGLIVGNSGVRFPRRDFLLSLIFVLAMAVTYAFFGVVAGAFNINLQLASQHPGVIILFSGVFVILALSMFGLYELQLPSRWQSALTTASRGYESGGALSVFVMGVLSALIVGPCVAPPLAGALLYVSQTGDMVLSGAALFFMGLGFGVPLLIVGTSAGKILPFVGTWMERIKIFFGMIMLGVAIWLLERFLPASLTAFLWALLLVMGAVYFGTLERISSIGGRFIQGGCLLALMYGFIMLASAVTGGGTLTQPFSGFYLHAQNGQQTSPQVEVIADMEDLSRALADAKKIARPAMLYFYADWCVVCKQIERETFANPKVRDLLSQVAFLKVDVTDNSATQKALLKRFNLYGPPAIIFFDKQGETFTKGQVVGLIDSVGLITYLRKLL